MDEHYHFSIAAGIGAALAAWREVNIPWPARALILFTGYGVAVCLGPWGADYFRISSDEGFTALLFFCGFYGHDLLGLLTTYLKKSTLEEVLKLLVRTK
jgi:hypothetical protein